MIMILSPDPNTLVEHRTYPHAHELDCWYQEDCNFLVLLQHYEHGSLFSCDQRVMENHIHHMLQPLWTIYILLFPSHQSKEFKENKTE